MLVKDVKEALGITHDKRNTRIEREIDWARAELVRVGVPKTIASDDNNALIGNAIVAGVCSHMASNDKLRGEYSAMWNISRDELRKHNWGI